jgi:uncharacterized coiled-coil protein SlyX
VKRDQIITHKEMKKIMKQKQKKIRNLKHRIVELEDCFSLQGFTITSLCNRISDHDTVIADIASDLDFNNGISNRLAKLERYGNQCMNEVKSQTNTIKSMQEQITSLTNEILKLKEHR